MEPISLGIKPLFSSWYLKVPERVKEKESLMNHIKHLIDGNNILKNKIYYYIFYINYIILFFYKKI